MNNLQKLIQITKQKQIQITTDIAGAGEIVAWSPGGDKLAVGTGWEDNGYHGQVIVFDSSGNMLWQTPDLGTKVISVSWSPAGDKVAVGTYWEDSDGNYHGRVIVPDSSGNLLWQTEDLGAMVYSVSWSPSGDKLAAVTSWKDVNWNYHGRVIVYDSSGNQLWQTSDLGASVWSVAWSPGGDKLAIGGYFRRVIVYDSSGNHLWQTPDLDAEVFSVAWSPGGDKLAVGVGGRVIVYDSSGNHLWQKDLGAMVWDVSWSPDGSKLAVGGWFKKVIVYDSSGNQIWRSENLGGVVLSVTWSPDGSKLAVGGNFRKVIIFGGFRVRVPVLGAHVVWEVSEGRVVSVGLCGGACGGVGGVLRGDAPVSSLLGKQWEGECGGVCGFLAGLLLGKPEKLGVDERLEGLLVGRRYVEAVEAVVSGFEDASRCILSLDQERFEECASRAKLYSGAAGFLLFGFADRISGVASRAAELGLGEERFYSWLWGSYKDLVGLAPLRAARVLGERLDRFEELLSDEKSEKVKECLGYSGVVPAEGLLDYLRDCVVGRISGLSVVRQPGGLRVCNRGKYPLVLIGDVPVVLGVGECRDGVQPGTLVEAPWGLRVDLGSMVKAGGVMGIGGGEPAAPKAVSRSVATTVKVEAVGPGHIPVELPVVLEGFGSGPGCGEEVEGLDLDILGLGGLQCSRLCLLGCGGWGCALRCESPGGYVVVKVPAGIVEDVRRGGGGAVTLSARLVRKTVERAEVLRLLDHPHILRLLAFSRKMPVLVYEFADLGSLEWQLGRGWRPGVGDVVRIGYALADALRYIHSRGLVHGDIKAGNIFVVSPGIVKLGDFSSLTRLLSKTVVRSVSYTPGWRPPELVDLLNLGKEAKRRGYENRADIYQLGNLLLYLLTGETIDGEDLLLEGPGIVEEAAESIESEPLRRIVLGMLVVNPWERPSSEEVTRILGSLLIKINEDKE